LAHASLWNLQLPGSVLLAGIAAIAYLLSYIRHRRGEFTLFDFLILVAIMAIVTAVTLPLLHAAGDEARSTALTQNLQTLRKQIDLYKIEHGGAPPVLFEGSFPQLTHATNAKGVPGPPGREYPYGPYFRSGLPVNPYTGVSVVEPTEVFPPLESTGTGGWLYEPKSGRITVDMAEHLGK